MPSGIIIKSASHEVSDEVRDANVKAVIESAGYEVPEPEPPAEPKREDFKTDEEHEAAHVEWQDKEDEKAAKAEEEEGVAPPKKSRRTRAIERATAEMSREREELRRENEELKKRLGEAAPAKQAEPPKEKQKPRRADFNGDDDAYDQAHANWVKDQVIVELAQQNAQAAHKAKYETLSKNYGTQVEEAKDKYEDWEEVINQPIVIGRDTQEAIIRMENGAEVSYYLGRHPNFAEKLGQMDPYDAVMEVTALSLRLKTGAPASGEANREEQPKPRPKVPAPVRTVNTRGSSGAPTFAEIAAKPNYPGKAKDLRAAQARGE